MVALIPLVVLLGPTASGKTELALRLAAPDGMGAYEGSGHWPIMIMHRELARLGLNTWRWARKPVETFKVDTASLSV